MAYSRGSGYHLPGKGLRRRIFQEKDLSDEFSDNEGLSLCFHFISSSTYFHCAPNKDNYRQICRIFFTGIDGSPTRESAALKARQTATPRSGSFFSPKVALEQRRQLPWMRTL